MLIISGISQGYGQFRFFAGGSWFHKAPESFCGCISGLDRFFPGAYHDGGSAEDGRKGTGALSDCLDSASFFYAAGYLILLWYLFRYPEVRWNLSKTVCMAFLILTGFLLECYVNPVLMQMFVETLQ